MNIISFEKYKDMIIYLNFKQDYYSRTAVGVYKIGHDLDYLNGLHIMIDLIVKI